MEGWRIGTYSDELVGNNLDTDQAANDQKIILTDTQQPSDGVEDVSKDEFNGQVPLVLRLSLRPLSWLGASVRPSRSDGDVLSPPGQNTVDHGQKRENDEQGRGNHASDLQTEPSTHTESVKSVLWLLLRLIGLWDDDAAGSESLFGFRVTELRNSKGSRNRHDA